MSRAKYAAVVILFGIGLFGLVFESSAVSFVMVLIGIGATIAMLYPPSEWVEDGFADVSSRLKISSLVAGAVFLASSSSAPEFFTAFSGVVLHGVFDIGIITLLWSALFNLCVILGVCALYRNPLRVHAKILQRDLPFYGVAITVLVILALDNKLSALDFGILIFVYLVYIGVLYFDKAPPYKIEATASWKKILARISIGLVIIGLLSHTLVTLGLRLISISEVLFGFVLPISLISIFIFVPGTSLADLFMSVAATKKGEHGTAIVNGVSSNTFDLTICLAVPGLIYTMLANHSVEINFFSLLPSFISVAAGYVVVFVISFTGRNILRWQGLVLNLFFVSAVVVQTILLI